MFHKKIQLGLIYTISLLNSLPSLALTEAVKKLVDFETKANAIAVRNSERVPVPHFEIPLKELSGNFAERLDPQIKKSLVFKKNGENYVRWILNPEDTHWFAEVHDYFLRKGIELTKEYYFDGYQTASRSYIIEDPITHVQFSAKSSTNVTAGRWTNKPQPYGEAQDSRLISNYLSEQNAKLPFQYVVVMDETAIYGLKGLDQAVVIRELGDLKNENSKFIYLPGFSALHESVGREIAKVNGSLDPYNFWSIYYVEAVGRAMGELAGRTGIQFDSPHSQNFLIELDKSLKPTGRIVIRDMADFYINSEFLENMSGSAQKLLQQYSQLDHIKDYSAVMFSPLKGTAEPSWVPKSKYILWKDRFFNAFDKSFKETTGISDNLKLIERRFAGRTFAANYKISKLTGSEDFFKKLKENEFVKPSQSLKCNHLFVK